MVWVGLVFPPRHEGENMTHPSPSHGGWSGHMTQAKPGRPNLRISALVNIVPRYSKILAKKNANSEENRVKK